MASNSLTCGGQTRSLVRVVGSQRPTRIATAAVGTACAPSRTTTRPNSRKWAMESVLPSATSRSSTTERTGTGTKPRGRNKRCASRPKPITSSKLSTSTGFSTTAGPSGATGPSPVRRTRQGPASPPTQSKNSSLLKRSTSVTSASAPAPTTEIASGCNRRPHTRSSSMLSRPSSRPTTKPRFSTCPVTSSASTSQTTTPYSSSRISSSSSSSTRSITPWRPSTSTTSRTWHRLCHAGRTVSSTTRLRPCTSTSRARFL